MKAFSHIKAFVSVIIALIAVNTQAQIRIVDSESAEPVDFASVFDNGTGKVVGLTTIEGRLPEGAEKLKSISIQHINYKTCDVNLAELQDTIVRMTPFSREIKDVKISKDPKAKIRLGVCTRSYTYINGRIAIINFEMGNLYFKNAKSESDPKYICQARSSFGDSTLLKAQSNFIRMLAACNNPTAFTDFNLCLQYDSLKGGKRIHSTWKREGTVVYMNEDSINKRCEIVEDSTFYDKPFAVWLLPIGVANVYTSETYSTENGKPRLYDLQNKTVMFRVIRKKTKEYVDVVTEFYITGVDYASKEDIKKDKEPLSESPKWPDNLPEINPNIKKAAKYMKQFRTLNDLIGEDTNAEKE